MTSVDIILLTVYPFIPILYFKNLNMLISVYNIHLSSRILHNKQTHTVYGKTEKQSKKSRSRDPIHKKVFYDKQSFVTSS